MGEIINFKKFYAAHTGGVRGTESGWLVVLLLNALFGSHILSQHLPKYNGIESRRKNANKNTQISVPAECIIHIQLCPCVSSGVTCKVSVAD